MSDRHTGYAHAMLNVAQAEGNVAGISSEIFNIGQAVGNSEELRNALSDRAIPADRRQQIVEDLLGGKASSATVGLVSMVVGAGRGGELPKIASELAGLAANEQGRQVATVRSAVALTEDQQQRLAAALKQSTGTDVDIQVVIDPTVVGGVVTSIGDTVIDGSIRSRLSKLRETL